MSKKRYALKNKTKFFSLLFIIFIIMFTLIYTASVSGMEKQNYRTVIVNKGDSLWSIAEKYSDDCDIRDYIYTVKKINNMNSSVLYENTAILVPAKN